MTDFHSNIIHNSKNTSNPNIHQLTSGQSGISLKGRLLVDKSAMNEVVIHAKM